MTTFVATPRILPASRGENLCRWFVCVAVRVACHAIAHAAAFTLARRVSHTKVSSVALQRFAPGEMGTYAPVSHGLSVAAARRACIQRAHAARFSFRAMVYRCHLGVAKNLVHVDCCMGAMTPWELKYAFHKGGIGMKRGVSFWGFFSFITVSPTQ